MEISVETLWMFISNLGYQEEGLVKIIKDIVYDYIGENYKWWIYSKKKNEFKLYQNIKIQNKIEVSWNKSFIKYKSKSNIHSFNIHIKTKFVFIYPYNKISIIFCFKNNNKYYNFEHVLLNYPTNNYNYENIIRLCTCANCIKNSQKYFVEYVNKKDLKNIIHELEYIKTSKLCKYSLNI